VLVMTANVGCFSERSFQMHPGDSVRLPGAARRAARAPSTRAWLGAAHQGLEHLLPSSSARPLLTEQLVDEEGVPVDVFSHFGVQRASLRSLFGNFRGIRCTAQAASRDYHIDKPAPPWPGFEDVWIPIKEDLSLSGRLGYARDPEGNVREADCIVILPGLFGDNGVKRSRDLAIPLRASGYHVLALEIRGHGQTEARYPDQYSTFGVLETDDLMRVSDWLEGLDHVRRTGLIGYCWSANIVLLAAWYDGRLPDDPMISPALRPHLSPFSPRRRFTAGVIAFSPIPRWELLMDHLEAPRSYLIDPIYAAIQDTVRDRMILKNYPEISGNLRRLIEYEYAGYDVPLPRGSGEGYPFLRLLPYKGEPAGDKLEFARVPVLIVHGADDPLSPAQDTADLIATIANPKVAAVILPSGGHVGFAAYAKEYYFSLVANFFDPVAGAVAASSCPPPARPGLPCRGPAAGSR